MAGRDGAMSRLYAVESLFTLTGMNADHRLRVPPSLMVAVVARMAREHPAFRRLGRQVEGVVGPGAALRGLDRALREGFEGERREKPGDGRLPFAARRRNMLVLAMNEALGAVAEHTVEFHEVPKAGEEDIALLAEALNAEQVQTLVILGGNPAYNAPVDLNWSQTQAWNSRPAKRLCGSDITKMKRPGTRACHAETQWDLPMAHFLESWGDARTANGTLVPIQPLIEPLFDGLTELEVLAILAGAEATKPYEIVRETFRLLGGPDENDWRKFLRDGFLAGSAAEPASVEFNGKLFGPVLALLEAPKSVARPGQSGRGFPSRLQDGRRPAQ